MNIQTESELTTPPASSSATLLERIVDIRSQLAAATESMMSIDTDKLPHYPFGGHVGMDALRHLMMNMRAAEREIATLIGQLEQHYPPVRSNGEITRDGGN